MTVIVHILVLWIVTLCSLVRRYDILEEYVSSIFRIEMCRFRKCLGYLWAPWLGFDSQQGQEIFIYYIASSTALGPTQPPIHWVQGALYLGVKQPGQETHHSPPSNVEVKTSTPRYVFMG
jgi:hypothetical protein